MFSKLLTTTAIVTALSGTMLPSISSADDHHRAGIQHVLLLSVDGFHAVDLEIYGTPRGPIEEALAAGRDVVRDVDW